MSFSRSPVYALLQKFLLSLSTILLLCGSALAQTVIVDNTDPGFTVESGTWSTGTGTGRYGDNYFHTGATGTAVVRYTPNLPQTGYYKVSAWYNSGTNRTTNAPYTIVGSGPAETVRINQTSGGGQFVELGTAHFTSGTSGYVTLSNSGITGASGVVVIADAIRWEYIGNTAPPADPEMRGVWVTRFEWPQSSWSTTVSRINTMMSNIRLGNFNSVFFQIRGQMNVHYPSPDEPVSGYSWINNTNDPVRHAVQKAHEAGLQFHAYINTHVIWQGSNGPSTSLSPTHPYYTHGNPNSSNPANRDWVIHLDNNLPQPLGTGESNYVWAAPGVPTFQEWTRRQIMYVANRYNVDGIHLDRIRFNGQGSYDPISLARSPIGSPTNPANLSFRDWNRDQVTRLINDLYGAIAELNYNRPTDKRRIALSSAPYRDVSSQLSVNQVLNNWTGLGAQDFFVPQIYVNNVTTLASHIDSNLTVNNGRHVVSGIWRDLTNSNMTFEDARDLILKAREKGLGTVVYSYSSMAAGEWAQYASTVYPTFVEPPSYPWLDSPTESIIVGTVTGPDNQPLTDAQIRRSGSTYTWLSGTDGFYAMLKVPANTAITLTANKTAAGLPNQTVSVPALTPGEVRRVNIKLNPSSITDWTLY